MDRQKNIQFFIFSILMVFCTMGVYLYRPLWFDEALTLMNFVHGKSLEQIYQSYIIPNNQIIYSICLRLWTRFTDLLSLNYDFGARLLSAVFSIIAVIAFYCGFKRESGGTWGMLFIVSGICLGVPFSIYGTAVRGYQLSFMLLVLLAWSVKNISRKVTWQNFSAYTILSLLLIGTIPTNLLGIGMAVGIFMPELWKKWKRLTALAIIPFCMFFIFYFPIKDKFINVCNLGEGLDNRLEAILIPYMAFILNYSVLTILGIWGWILACRKRKIHYCNLFRFAAILLWLIPCLILQKAPFNRVFYPCFALLLIVTSFGIKHWIYLFFRKLSNNGRKITVIICAILLISNFLFLKSDYAGQKIQQIFKLTPATDDFFMPYYFRENFYPPAVINKINRQYINNTNLVFSAFEADSRALYFYAVFGSTDSSRFVIDGPKFKVAFLPYKSLLILPSDDSCLDKYIKRFNLENRQLKKLFTEGFHTVWEVQ